VLNEQSTATTSESGDQFGRRSYMGYKWSVLTREAARRESIVRMAGRREAGWQNGGKRLLRGIKRVTTGGDWQACFAHPFRLALTRDSSLDSCPDLIVHSLHEGGGRLVGGPHAQLGEARGAFGIESVSGEPRLWKAKERPT
jgi:hypothetical protein